MRAVKYVEDLDGEDDKIGNLTELTTIQNQTLDNFIKEMPFVNLTPNKAKDVETASYEQLSEGMESYRKKASEDTKRIAILEADLEKAKANKDGPFALFGKALDKLGEEIIKPFTKMFPMNEL